MEKQQPLKDANPANYPLLFEMLRSFAMLADKLNLSHAVDALGSTRQTVKRHISQLEESLKEPLFVVNDRRYQLTPAGHRALPQAQSILAQGKVWLSGQFDHIEGMMRLSFDDHADRYFHQQQQPISNVWAGSSTLLKDAIKAWSAAEGQLESSALVELRPFILVYRDSPSGWICVEIGEKSFYSNWFGWVNARSSVGRPLNQFPGGAEFANLMNVPFQDVSHSRGIRLDQVFTKIPSQDGARSHLIGFDRLLLGVSLPDESPALCVVVDRAHKMQISDLDPSLIDDIPAGAEPNFNT